MGGLIVGTMVPLTSVPLVGLMEGILELVGAAVGISVGLSEGILEFVGEAVGKGVGLMEGMLELVGEAVGTPVGLAVGEVVGEPLVGEALG